MSIWTTEEEGAGIGHEVAIRPSSEKTREELMIDTGQLATAMEDER